MRDATDLLALYDDLSPDEQVALRDAIGTDPVLAEAAARWRSLRAGVRAELSRDLPDRSVLVLHALADRPDDITEADRARLANADLESALAAHPGLVAAVERIRADRDAFEAAWTEHARLGDSADRPAEVDRVARRGSSQRARAASRSAVPSASRPARSRPTRWVWRAAAMMAVVGFGALLTFLYARDADFQRIAAGEQMLVALADGSEVELAPGAVLMIPRENSDVDPRQARLMTGTALFDIVRDPTAPFNVQTPNADVTVLGTTFSVEITEVQDEDATKVVLASGSVRVAPRAMAEQAVTLEPGQSTEVVRFDAPAAPRATDVAADLEWTGELYARELSAAEVARRIAQATGRKVEVDAVLAGEPVSGTFHLDEGAEAALRPLALTLGADLLRTAEGFRLAK
ncbi:MAG: FecR domain-containing protein [Bacteroidota bacterium]